MAESICRALRDGALDGEHAPALTIKDSINSPFGPLVFNYVVTQLSSNILAGKSQSRALVLVTLSRSPSFYVDLLKNKGTDIDSLHKWLGILDCYSDPLGWKYRLGESGSIMNSSPAAGVAASLCKDMRDLDKLLSSINELGKGLLGEEKGRFSVAIDSVSVMLRYASMSSVAGLLSHLRSHGQISSVFWLVHEDLHEIRVPATLEYMSSMLASIEPMTQPINAQRGNTERFPLVEQNFNRGMFHVRFKRRNGRVRVVSEEIYVEQSGIKFMSFSSEDGVTQTLVPKVQFNLQLSEKERFERAKVILPFEHQGNGKSIQIYDGRKSLNDGEIVDTKPVAGDIVQSNEESGRGEIIYFRDSDDEMPDSDEDPDDDLDI